MTDNIRPKIHQSPEYREELLSAALDGALSPAEQAELDAHLATCATCPAELSALRQVRTLLRAMPEPALPRSFLLPAEEAVGAVHVASAAPRQPAGNVTPMHAENHGNRGNRGNRSATRTLVATRWIGAIAAVLGLALFLGTVLPGAFHQNYSYSASAPSTGGQSSNPADAASRSPQLSNPSPTRASPGSGDNQSTDKAATATAVTVTPTFGQATATASPTAHEVSSGPMLVDILRVIAIVLIVAGIAATVFGYILARRL